MSDKPKAPPTATVYRNTCACGQQWHDHGNKWSRHDECPRCGSVYWRAEAA